MERFDFWAIFAVVFIAEIPCILRTVALQLHTQGIWGVVGGTIAGSLAALFTGVLIAKLLTAGIPEQFIHGVQIAAGLSLIIIGFLMMFHRH